MSLRSNALVLVGATASLLLAATSGTVAPLGKYTAAERRHWAFLPRAHPAPPTFDSAADKAWTKSPMDAFVLARMQEESLSHAPQADRATLVRRVTFDLTGLPPTPAEVSAFINDRSANAWEKLVDRLLASEHYGEHWGHHWLDIVRFAETEGFEYDNLRPDAWRYRDYVIRAFNNDKPYDRFVQEQLAGDEIAPKEDETLIAAGFNRLGPVRRNAGNQAVASSRNEQLTEMTNIVGAGIMGVTLGCARCHDHKFDSFRQSDYYRVQAFFAPLQPFDLITASDQEQTAWKAKATPIQAHIAQLQKEITQATKAGASTTELMAKLEEEQDALPAALPSLFTVRDDFANKAQIHLLPRGDFEHPGDAVGMRLPGVFLPDGAPELPEDTANPRELLAQWLTSADNPLTARVMVNRIWEYHFGRGIVATPNDFGRMGERPVNAELLDYLANEFVAGGWSVKHMQRLILLSNTYQQSSAPDTDRDPDGRYVARFPRQRLEAEQIRDAMLSVSGLLNQKTSGPGVMVPIDKTLVQALYKRRSVYLIYKRNLELPFMQVFDAPDMTLSCPRRESSTHAPQALEMLNGDFANQMAKAFSARLLKEAGPDHRRQIELAWRLAVSRAPKPAELKMAMQFLNVDAAGESQARDQLALAMFNLNAFLYVN
jgi:hypothetical protein